MFLEKTFFSKSLPPPRSLKEEETEKLVKWSTVEKELVLLSVFLNDKQSG